MTNEPTNENPIGFPSIRIDGGNPLHHIWCNNGTWWIHYTLHFHGRKRRVRRSLDTGDVATATVRRDEFLARLGREGEPVPPRQRHGPTLPGPRHHFSRPPFPSTAKETAL